MASANMRVLLDKTLTGNEVSSALSLELYETDFIAVLLTGAITGGTLAGTIQHSADGINWANVATFTGLTAANGQEIQPITAKLLPKVRANLTYLGTSVQAKVYLYNDVRK